MNNEEVAVRKRTQISKANRMMFFWIAGASALIGASAVVGVFLWNQLTYNEKVLSAKLNTATTLESNLTAIETLSTEVRALDANANLASIKANVEDQALQVILDALPYDANALALGASLQNKLFANIDGLQPIEQLSVTSAAIDEFDEGEIVEAAPENEGMHSITFTATIEGTEPALKKVLENLQRSIRTIEVTAVSFDVQRETGGFRMTLQARAYYQPTTELKLYEKEVPR